VALGTCDDGGIGKSKRKVRKLLNEIGDSGPVVFTTIELETTQPNVSQKRGEHALSKIAFDKVRYL